MTRRVTIDDLFRNSQGSFKSKEPSDPVSVQRTPDVVASQHPQRWQFIRQYHHKTDQQEALVIWHSDRYIFGNEKRPEPPGNNIQESSYSWADKQLTAINALKDHKSWGFRTLQLIGSRLCSARNTTRCRCGDRYCGRHPARHPEQN